MGIYNASKLQTIKNWLNAINNNTTREVLKRQMDLLNDDDSVVGDVLAAEHGAGAIGTAFAPRTYRYNLPGNVIVTEIHVDVTGLGQVGTAAKDAIGLVAGGSAYIGRYVTATYGIVYQIEMICVESPTEGTATFSDDIDLGAEAAVSIYDNPVDNVIVNAGGILAGQMAVAITPALTANDYIYLIEGDTTASTGVLASGQYIIRFYGHALLS